MTSSTKPRRASTDRPAFAPSDPLQGVPAKAALVEAVKDNIALDRTTLPEQIAVSLRGRIAAGELKPEDRLIEAEHVELYRVSRHTLREAIAILVGERLLTRTAFKGVEVTRLRAPDIRDIYAARRAIELPAVDLLPTAPPNVKRDLKRAIRKLASLPASAGSSIVNNADSAIHCALVAAHASHRMSGTHAALMAELHVLLFKTYGPDDKRLALERHTAFESLIDAGHYRRARDQLDARLRFSEEQMVQACDA